MNYTTIVPKKYIYEFVSTLKKFYPVNSKEGYKTIWSLEDGYITQMDDFDPDLTLVDFETFLTLVKESSNNRNHELVSDIRNDMDNIIEQSKNLIEASMSVIGDLTIYEARREARNLEGGLADLVTEFYALENLLRFAEDEIQPEEVAVQ